MACPKVDPRLLRTWGKPKPAPALVTPVAVSSVPGCPHDGCVCKRLQPGVRGLARGTRKGVSRHDVRLTVS
ncbi:MAG: hypothetical protein K8U57_28775 [Planctomycetes bacterium]|nr:hypothetical protein [Planctomycetota bacterium]